MAEVIDEKIAKGEYTGGKGNDFYFDYNGETLKLVCCGGQYDYSYNQEYYLVMHNLPDERPLGY